MPPRIPTEEDFSSISSTLPHTLHFPSPPESTTTFLVLFHGLGDQDAPFASFAKNLNLPGVMAISVRGTSVLPAAIMGDDTPGYYWGDDLTIDPNTGDIATDSGFEKARAAVMDKLIRGVLVEKCGWETSDVIFFGFGQGGSLALGLASSLDKESRVTDVTDGDKPEANRFKGAVSLGGPLPQSMVSTVTNRSKSRTSVLICQLYDDDVDAVKSEFEDVKVVQWQRREVGMPISRDEVLPLMQFFADKLKSEL
ncbi:Ff.00g125740.m01.CDS01 [Fusarium sp. VM40]|nr:Ff.00g125740.m01.CDS01 [Fusarium sp. VM40]